jgi:AraC family transcriptional regulator, positive regulator of tynA and feaB
MAVLAMEQLFSTHQVHERDRFDYWHNIACKTIIDHSSWPECRENFYAEIRTGSLGDISLVLFENAAMKVSRTAKQVARTVTDDLFVCRQVAGTLAIEQAGRECVLEAGDIALLDPTLPYEGKFSLGSNLFVLKVPRRELQARIGNTKEVAARS